ncbi:globin [Stieleria marina]|uniref:Globin domain-containing protein n=1 Tax=Stieleria marina TaxID=1930275 RepID=A0A517NM21_9BACT|nr:hypothetical protein K239x_00550 [Planctomycetes bacterium K23_9]
MDGTHKDLFLGSLDRCSENRNFIPVFYERFLSRSDAIRDKFKNTDFEKQNEMLLRSLKLAAGATSGDPSSLREIRERAETHDRHHLNIEPSMYETWMTTVIEVASEYDTAWTDEVEEAWTAILGHVITHMVKFY